MVYNVSSIQNSNQMRNKQSENVIKINLSGKRKYVHPNGTLYDGMFKNGKLNGFGTIFYPTKTLEEGYFENNCLNGTGRITNIQMSFEGQFKNGSLIEGKIKLSDGTSYEGKFIEDLLNSSLIEENPREEILSKILFEGRITFPNGTIYENKVKNNVSVGLIDSEDDTENEGHDDHSTSSCDESIIEIGSEFDHVDWQGIAAEMMHGYSDDMSDSSVINNLEPLNGPPAPSTCKGDSQNAQYDNDEISDVDSDLDQIDWARVAEGIMNGHDFDDDLSVTSEDVQHQSLGQFKDTNLSIFNGSLFEEEILNGFGVRKFHDQTEEGFFTNNQLNGFGKIVFSDGISLEGLFKNGSFIEGRITLSENLFFEGKFNEEALNSDLKMSEFNFGLCKSSMLEGTIHFPSGIEERHDKNPLLNGIEVLSEIDDQDQLDCLNADFDENNETHLSIINTGESTNDVDFEYDMLSEFEIKEKKADNQNQKEDSLDDDNEWIILNNIQLRG